MSDKKSIILLVEDDARIMGFNERKLKRHGYVILKANTLEEARSVLRSRAPHLIVLDVMLPDGTGFEFCDELRKSSDIPVLFLTGRTQVSDRIEGLNGGGDYYMTKPYDYDEFVAVVGSLLRRSEVSTSVSAEIEWGPIMLDTVSSSAMLDGQDLFLTPKEFAILLLLVQNADKEFLSGDFIYEKVWNMPMQNDGRALWVQMSRLRKKLERNENLILNNDRNSGYSIEYVK